MADGAPPDERLGHGAHLDRRDDARDDAVLFEGVLERERVDHGREHAHVVGGRAVHPARARGDAPEDVAAADHHRRLCAHRLDFADLVRDLRGHGRIDPVALVAHERFAGQLEKDAFVRNGGIGHEPEL